MKTKKLIMVSSMLLLGGANLFAQVQMEMKDMFDELNDQIQDSTSVISTICYAIAGICFFVGAIQVGTKLLRGQEVGKDVGLYFGGLAFFALAGYLCSKFWS